jgi:hypothetical protein
LIKYLKLKIYNFGFVFREFSLQKASGSRAQLTSARPAGQSRFAYASA